MTRPEKAASRLGARSKSGSEPGILVHVGERKVDEALITCTRYNASDLKATQVKTVDDCFPLRGNWPVNWVNVDGLHDVEIVRKVGDYLNIHPLVLEDILTTDQRPKIEDFGRYLFVVVKTLSHDAADGDVVGEQISLIIGSNYLISFRERESDIFSLIQDRLQKPNGRLRQTGPDFLAYALLDAIVDNYFVIFEKIGEEIENLEDELVSNPTPETLQEIHKLKRTLVFLRRSVWPLREVIGRLERQDSDLIKEATGAYFRDVYDHTVQVLDTIESYHEMIAGMLDIYLSSVSNRLNEVMKVLTIIATIFIPLTFLTGVFGMNFKYMSVLDLRFGFLGSLLVMLLIALLMAVYFRRKGWF
jgi:magnesium transporter